MDETTWKIHHPEMLNFSQHHSMYPTFHGEKPPLFIHQFLMVNPPCVTPCCFTIHPQPWAPTSDAAASEPCDVSRFFCHRKRLKIPRSVYHGKMVKNNKHGEQLVVFHQLNHEKSWIDRSTMEKWWKIGIWPIKMLIYSLKIRIQQPLKKIVSVNFITYLTSELQLSSMSLGLLYT